MDVDDGYLTVRNACRVALDLSFALRCELRELYGKELAGADDEGVKRPFRNVIYYDYSRPAVSAGDVLGDGRDWIAIDTAFGRRYLVLADNQGGFILVSLLDDNSSDVLVEFKQAAIGSKPNRHADNYTGDTRLVLNYRQYARCIGIAAELLADEI